MTKSNQNSLPNPENNILSPLEKCPESSHLMLEKGEPRQTLTTESLPSLKREPFSGFQMKNNAHFDTVKAQKRLEKAPRYRIMKVYVKSKKQYWKERNRRKQVMILSDSGLSYEQIAEKLGISIRTVQRDLKKLRPHILGKINNSLSELRAKENRDFHAMLEGKNLWQQYNILTDMIANYKSIWKMRDYVRHLLKIYINMDDLSEGCPSITKWPSYWKGELPIHIHFIVRQNGKETLLGGFTLDKSRYGT